MPSYHFNERFYIVYNINLIMFYDLLIFIFMSYIKPQPLWVLKKSRIGCISYYSYIKPQLSWRKHHWDIRCISYYSYFNPQHFDGKLTLKEVVYRTIPTSNHNLAVHLMLEIYVVYRTIPTSNHNSVIMRTICRWVVYRTIPTSNHNKKNKNKKIFFPP